MHLHLIMCACIACASIYRCGPVWDAGSINTGWLYDLSSEIWKGYTATRFYRCRSACASIDVCGHLFIRASIYLLIDAGAYKYMRVHLFSGHLFINAYASIYRCGHLYINACAYIYRCGHVLINASVSISRCGYVLISAYASVYRCGLEKHRVAVWPFQRDMERLYSHPVL